MGYTNSSLVSYTKISPNKTINRTHVIDRITPHCFVGQVTAKRGCEVFFQATRKASCNYVVGNDGQIGLCVEEKDRSWCSSNAANDHRAVTIEIASDTTDPYAITDAAYKSTVNLMEDICRRNGKNKLLWFADKTKSLNYQPKDGEMVITVHRWFAAKACPGDYIYSRLGKMADEVNQRLNGNKQNDEKAVSQSGGNNIPTSVPFTVNVLVSDLNIRDSASMSGRIKGVTGKGVFTIVEVKNGWGLLKSKAGWIYLENSSYVSINSVNKGDSSSLQNKVPESATTNVDKTFMVKVTVSELNIRKGPGTNYSVSGKITNKGTYTIVEEQNGWGKLKSGAGWISISDKYVKRI